MSEEVLQKAQSELAKRFARVADGEVGGETCFSRRAEKS